jgi:hypothetical protein
MNDFVVGKVVIVGTGQAGTIVESIKRDVWVLLRNNDVWVGPTSHIRFPQDEADLAACPIDVERLEPKIIRRED